MRWKTRRGATTPSTVQGNRTSSSKRITRGIRRSASSLGVMEDYAGRSEDIKVKVGELETHLLGPTDVVGFITVLAKNACDGGGYRELVFFKKSEGNPVAAAGRYAALQENQESDHRELKEAIELMNEKQNRLLATMERQEKLMSGYQEEIQRKVLQDVLVLKDKIFEVDNELHKAGEEMMRPTVGRWKAEAEGLRVSYAS